MSEPPKRRRKLNNGGVDKKDERRAGNSVISLTQFAHSKGKGTRRAIENYKQKKQNKFNHNANLLRGYRKAMKKEGYEAGKGASRKRILHDVPPKDEGENEDSTNIVDNELRAKKKRKTDPFAKARMKAEQNKLDLLKRKQEHTEELERQKKKQQEKKIRTKKLAKRTKRGQPIMKNMIEDMLDKIKSQS